MRKVASHYLLLPDGTWLPRQVVELSDGIVAGYYPLGAEQEDTEWLPGVIELVPDSHACLVAFWSYPFDFSAMKPVGETRRRQLL